MSETIPKMRQVMTSIPVTMPADLSMTDAAQRMYDHGIRHLPVVDEGTLVGIISQRDVAVLEGAPGLDPARVAVHKVMTTAPYSCSPDEPLDQVAAEMFERKVGAVVVVDDGKPVGIFTTTDALRELASCLGR